MLKRPLNEGIALIYATSRRYEQKSSMPLLNKRLRVKLIKKLTQKCCYVFDAERKRNARRCLV